ncbi:MAG: DAK2 domain-containing protein, partial [Acidimicrobiales bacterium]
ILSQILRGLSGTFRDSGGAVGSKALAEGLSEADTAARAGVMRPVEGTILTVAAAAAGGARTAAEEGGTLEETAARARLAAVEALARTPELLPVLERAGVVDAGGAGLVLLFDSLLHTINGTPFPGELPLPRHVAALLASAPREETAAGTGAETGAEGALNKLAETAHGEHGDPSSSEDISALRYEVMYFLEAPDESVPAFKEVWAGIGDSIVVVGGEGVWNCHIHTDDIGGSIEAAIDAGRPRNIRVTDLLEQVEEESWVRRAEESAALASKSGHIEAEEPPVTSVIAVATGDGIRRIFHSLGVRQIVAGGQSMNPSTAQILEVIEDAPGAEVVLLPNNKNIYAVARQAAEIASKPTRVVPTPGIQEGFAALLEYDPESGCDDNAAAMAGAAERVVAGEITQAVRTSETGAGHVESGEWLGLSRDGVEVVAKTAADAACALLDKIVTSSHEMVTIIEGAGARAADTRRITEWLSEQRPAASVELHGGGQPLYPYLVSAE